ncbi:hypothetical protein KEU06_20470 [Pseudaminobacter sp. 19-2017]|uniref:Uncharacterized protein n=1 Tax=Pseudaminobacter soli (ex Zhang et al. 2022) TaxID=2831468 RepID=A0A942IAX6_9HYPH|nr:hypothetical protein [Pseudaminobacter soli]MBS3650991.1 hypothetical protein [Pseudaminobacter soli]
MDQKLVAVLQTVGSLSRQQATTALAGAFVAVGARRHAVRAARNGFSAILAHARNGTPQLIGHKPMGMTILVSLSDLVDMVQAAAKKQSFGEALDAEGFRPVFGKKIAVRPGLPPEPLVRRRIKEANSE